MTDEIIMREPNTEVVPFTFDEMISRNIVEGYKAGLTVAEFRNGTPEPKSGAFLQITVPRPEDLEPAMHKYFDALERYREEKGSPRIGGVTNYESAKRVAQQLTRHEMEHVRAAKELGITTQKFGIAMMTDELGLPDYVAKVTIQTDNPIKSFFIKLAPEQPSIYDINDANYYLKEFMKHPFKVAKILKGDPDLSWKFRQGLSKLLIINLNSLRNKKKTKI